jgi:hypothetical protein
MDKLLKYQEAIIALLQEYADYYNGGNDVKHYVIKDKENHHYQLIAMGFRNGVFIHSCVFHFDIIKDKVWLQVNETANLIADELIEKGVPKKDIVLGFHEPHLRQYTGFAVA